MKKCPVCAEEIKAEARLCRFCGARFEVTRRGYCTTCHHVMDADENDACSQCGKALVDLHVESELIKQSTTSATPDSVSASPLTPIQPKVPPKRKLSSIIWVLVIVVGVGGMCLLLTTMVSRLPDLASKILPAFSGTLQPLYSAGSKSTPKSSTTPIASSTPTPLPVGAAYYFPSTEKGAACLDSSPYGLTCLDESGWHTFNSDNSPLESNSITDIAPCPDGTLLIGTYNTVFRWDGEEWQSLPKIKAVSHVTCGPSGEIWAATSEGLSTFDGMQWTHYETQQVTSNLDPEVLSDCSYVHFGRMTITPEGDFWSIICGNLVRFDGNNWTGINSPTSIKEIKSEQAGGIWAISYNEVHHYSNENWETFQNPREGQFTDLIVDQDNRVWLSTTKGDVVVFEDGSWQSYDGTVGGLIDSELNHIALDGRGRLWVGSKWGLGVFDGQNWIAYQMFNADLVDFDIGKIVVQAGGPDLPPAVDKELGTIRGRILIAGEAARSKKVEVCQFHMGTMIFFTGSPCSGKHLIYKTTTDENGVFQFSDLPPGYYSLFYAAKEDDWRFSQRILVIEGEEIVLDDILGDK